MRRYSVLALTVLLACAGIAAWPNLAVAQKRQRVALPEGTVLTPGTRPVVSADGGVGFVAPAVGDTVIAFAVRTGEVLGRLDGYGSGAGLALHEGGARRLLVLTLANDPNAGQPAAVVIVDATDPSALAVSARFVLPGNVEIAPGARAEIARGQKYGVVAIGMPVPALLSFDVETGQQVGALTLDGLPDSVSIVETGEVANVAVASSLTNEVAILSLADNGVLLPISTFAPPDGAPISSANNVAFDASGKIAYVGSLRGRSLLSFSVETGELVDQLQTDGSSAGIAIYHTPDHDLIAVANISRPGGMAEEDVAPKASEPPLGLPGAVVVQADPGGKLTQRSRFYPETGEELAPANNPEFSVDGSTVFVPARTGSLYVVDAKTGRSRAKESLDNRVQSIAAAPLAEAVAVVSAGGSEGHIDIIPTSTLVAEEPKPEATDRPSDAEKNDAKDRDEPRRATGPPAIDRLAPTSIAAGRRRDLSVTVIGSGFGEGATVVIGDARYGALVNAKGKRVNFTLPASLLVTPASIPVQVRNPDGTLSNIVSFEVTTALVPLVSKVTPDNIVSGVDGIDLKVRGDHFRDGAIARVSYVDATGANQSLDLKTYRLSFTSIVARLPAKLTQRAEDFSLTILDRDGTTASAEVPVKVVGPSIAKIEPERVVAGDVGADESFDLHVTGANFHTDAIVFVKAPLRGNDDGAMFHRVPASSVNRKSDTKIVVKLTSSVLSNSGTLVVRVVNPVPGERRKNGDPVDFNFTVAGPVIVAADPNVVVAGSDAFTIALTGTDFRRSATIKFQREGGRDVTRKKVVIVDDPEFKGRKKIRVDVDTPDLLRMMSRPGTVNLRVINPNGAAGDPSPAAPIQVVGPTILFVELVPRESDPTDYRLTLTGQYFKDGAVVQIYDVDGNPVGQPIEARLKGEDKLVAFIGRNRVTSLRTFKVVVVNPGGAYNPGGVASMPADVTLQ